ncbi:hypothetical protein C0991_003216 [Blastosporella zonata]|nr:hypothetical protein C0991_003216 [Blastosporella zonata]
MAPREIGGVVDNKMIVYGTKNLRVVDAGSMPINIAAHTVATIYVMAERASPPPLYSHMSDIIISDRRITELNQSIMDSIAKNKEN